MKQEEKVCQNCGTGITGRADKRFCSDQCRSTATNLRNRGDEGEMLLRHINHILRRNRYILRQASPKGKTTLRRSVLELSGFDFRYFTHLYRTKQGNTYYLCYETATCSSTKTKSSSSTSNPTWTAKTDKKPLSTRHHTHCSLLRKANGRSKGRIQE